jgi:hypothetical protein
MGNPGSPIRSVSTCCFDGPRKCSEQPVEKLVAQAADTGDFGDSILGGKARRCHHGNNSWNVLRSGTAFSLLTSTQLPSSERNTLTNNECANAFWPTKFVSTQTERVDRGTSFGDVGPAKGLHRV